ncbi:hypothetical protein HJC23_007062 [Cyclotella cryptica]|uniref:Uncharacterized protein n=1 Tax=Cyclotella cryptica TaxID=29204 RepID=A0ABD3PBV3_9STRA
MRSRQGRSRSANIGGHRAASRQRKLLFVTPTEETAEGRDAANELGDRAAMESSRLPSSKYIVSAEAVEGDMVKAVPCVIVVVVPPWLLHEGLGDDRTDDDTDENGRLFLESSELRAEELRSWRDDRLMRVWLDDMAATLLVLVIVVLLLSPERMEEEREDGVGDRAVALGGSSRRPRADLAARRFECFLEEEADMVVYGCGTIVSTKYEFIRTAQLYRDLHGGGQERDTAIACIQQIFPRAKITPKCVDQYPIRVVIEAHDAAGSTKGVVIWKGDQKSLFRKYASKRKAAQEEIVRRLEELRADGF